MSSRASKCADEGGVGTESSGGTTGQYELGDVVEPALARTLVLAAEAQRWALVAQDCDGACGTPQDNTSPLTRRCPRRASLVKLDLDENLPASVAPRLAALGHDVHTALNESVGASMTRSSGLRHRLKGVCS